MPTPVKVQLQFLSSAGYGWTEIHWINTQTTTPQLNNVITLVEANLCPFRRQLLGEDSSINGIRASYPTQGVVASKSDAPFFPGTPGQGTGSQNDSLAIQMYDSTNTRKKIIHMRGMWSIVIEDEAYHPEFTNGQYQGFMDGYLLALINNGFGWMGKNPALSVYGKVTGYTVNASDQVAFTCVTTAGSALFNSLDLTKSYEVQISKINHSHSNLNRSWVCTPSVVQGQNILTTDASIGTGAFTNPGHFNISILNFIGYSSFGSIKLGERRMGRPLGRYPGRRSRRPVI